MNITKTPPDSLDFPSLFTDYLNQNKKILEFFNFNPFNKDHAPSILEQLKFKGSRSETVRLLIDYNSRFNPPEKVLSNIHSLENENTYAVVTGQQPMIFGGTLFTIYKTLTAIIYCKLYSSHTGHTFVPVFWLGDEDHDYDEVAELHVHSQSGLEDFKWETHQNRQLRTADILIKEEFEDLKKGIKEALGNTDFSDGLWELIEKSYSRDNSAGFAFGKLMMQLFGKHGLILAGSNNRDIKNSTKSVLQTSVERQDEIFQSLTLTSGNLESSGYHSQVKVQQSNLFRIAEDGTRFKLYYSDGKWSDESGNFENISPDQLISMIGKHPENFSPNVFLRPLMQDRLLPTVAYVGGPGEISYYAQMKEIYGLFDQTMPVILPRFSCTLIETSVKRALESLPFKWTEYNRRIEDLESDFVDHSDKPDIESIIGSWKKEVEELTEKMKPLVGEVDPTLENSAGKASAAFFNELDKLKGKMYRSVKQQEKVQVNRIAKVQEALFPNGNLQEREIAFIYFMNKYGSNIWDELYEALSGFSPDTHYVIEL
jgi:bacillithiol biosynthesis cysteine-adding enzyme BshC